MSAERILKKVREEIENTRKEVQNEEGLLRLQEVMERYNGEHRLIWADDLKKQIEARPKVESYKTGITLLDEITDGFREQQLITVSAHSKHGKTAFAIYLMEVLEQLRPVLIPLEQSAEELITQRDRNGYYIPKFLTPEKLAARVTIDWIEERVVEGIAKHGSRMVVIDHLGYIDDHGDGGRYGKENLSYRIQVLMQELKTVAKKWNVLVILLCHISQQDEGKPPTLADLKGSSGILQESDKVLLLWIKNEIQKKVRVYSNKVLLNVAANRQTGAKGNIGLSFDTSTGKYSEDNSWVASMEEAARSSIQAEESFHDY